MEICYVYVSEIIADDQCSFMKCTMPHSNNTGANVLKIKVIKLNTEYN